ncbi:hypothetical protein IC582_016174 [Cucumis melo]
MFHPTTTVLRCCPSCRSPRHLRLPSSLMPLVIAMQTPIPTPRRSLMAALRHRLQHNSQRSL